MKCWAACLTLTACFAQSGGPLVYEDPQNRFTFSYPAAFGIPSPGTNNGFGDRVASIRFARFSAGVQSGAVVLGGEAVLMRGFPLLDLRAAGGLYDEITLEIFPQPVHDVVLKALEPLTASNFCAVIARERHVDPTSAVFASLAPRQKEALSSVDQMGNVNPKIVSCQIEGDTIRFDKEVAFQAGAPRNHIYGAVRFLREPYSMFQLIRGTGNAPSAGLLDQITEVVKSWRGR
jgi:hypothetical protein